METNNNSKKIFATNLKRLMDKKGVSASMVCSDLNIPNTTFSDWCNEKSYPRIKKIIQLAEYFGVPKYELTEEKESLKLADFDPLKLFSGPGAITYDEYLEIIDTSFKEHQHAFLAVFSEDAQLRSLREITPRAMGKKWSKYEIEQFDIANRIRPHVEFDKTEKTEFQLIQEYVEYLTEEELVALSKYIDYILVASKLQ